MRKRSKFSRLFSCIGHGAEDAPAASPPCPADEPFISSRNASLTLKYHPHSAHPCAPGVPPAGAGDGLTTGRRSMSTTAGVTEGSVLRDHRLGGAAENGVSYRIQEVKVRQDLDLDLFLEDHRNDKQIKRMIKANLSHLFDRFDVYVLKN